MVVLLEKKGKENFSLSSSIFGFLALAVRACLEAGFLVAVLEVDTIF